MAARARRKQTEGTFDKGLKRIEDTVESEQQAVAERIDSSAESVESMGAKVAQRTSQMEQTAFNTIGGYIRKGSDYIRGMNIRGQVDRAASSVRKNPAQTLLIAVGIGLLLGFIIRRR